MAKQKIVVTGIANIEDPYDKAIEALGNGDIVGIVKGSYGARVIECVPIAILNIGINLKQLVSSAINQGVQNQFLYLLKETKLVAEHLQRHFDPKSELDELIAHQLDDMQALGLYPPKEPQDELQRLCKVRGAYNHLESFVDRAQLYKDGNNRHLTA